MASLRSLAVASVALLAQIATAGIIIPRALSIPTDLPNNWTYVACYIDNADGKRALGGDGYNNGTSMTVEDCALFCMDKGYSMAGTEYGAECYCGDKPNEASTIVNDSECSVPCAGDATQPCGAGNRLSVYSGPAKTPMPPAAIGGWKYEGCYTEGTGGRTLTFGAGVPGGSAAMTNNLCTTACRQAGYTIAGTEYSGECYCGNEYANGGAQISQGCNMACNGDSTQICGGGSRLSVWSLIGSGSNPTSTISTRPSQPTSPGSPAALPAAWAYKGCYTEGSSGRAFLNQQPDSQTLSVESCVEKCVSLGYGVAGMEYGAQCFCDNFVRNGAELVSDSDCSMSCSGNPAQKCGAGNRLSVYSNATLIVYQPPKPQTENLPANWAYNATISECIAGCSRFGYEAGGIEYGYQCFCGDVPLGSKATLLPETECNVACPGDPQILCGGGNRISYYRWTGPQLTKWSYASGPAAGRYDFIMSAPLIPLISTVGINDKVVFVEKHGTGEGNHTGSFEFDPSLAPQYGTAFRELQLKTDVFCSGSIVMPDKAGRQINLGGWSLDSLYGVRLFTPDSPLGTNGTNQWEEDYTKLKLMDGRWYPTALTLSNGSILVMGGEDGSDGPMVPSAEVVPKPAGVTASTHLDYLANVEKVNSYPFVAVMPSGNMFFAQYNEARLISQVDFHSVRSLPKMPGAVNNPDAGRNYPLQGTMMLMPQHAPYTDPMTVLVCGGTTDGANFGIDNCISTEPDNAGAQWRIERMPSTRVVSLMVALPDGRYVIMGGSYNGRAGFGLQPDPPNLSAVLYDPTKPLGARMTMWANTTIPRLYHSEAVLMSDGRILVSGSDPEDAKHPQEHRLEYFSPDYILSGDWAYGATVNFQLTSTSGGAIRVSLLAAVGSTHGNSMGQRTLFPAVTCNGNACTVTAPPNANVSPPSWYQMFVLDGPTPSQAVWVRIGGDPARLGDWPQIPGFTHPGV
ncbi:fungistatic metabolite [Apiospora hydei]|uniref:Fungistatic metabolite n=1 Tax=Apiospora hydei TaxID=1337664 RepID=A0ABR1XE27_9PEZI